MPKPPVLSPTNALNKWIPKLASKTNSNSKPKNKNTKKHVSKGKKGGRK
jgi:hypothetical protein